MTNDTRTHDTNSPVIPGIIRKMSLAERMFFMSPACTVMMAARIAGTIDETRFRQALATVSRVHPMLRAKVVFDQRYDGWFSSENVPEVPLRIISRQSGSQWLDELKQAAREPFDICNGPLIKCVLIRNKEVSDLLVLCNHSICDGMALAIFIRDLLERYGNPDLPVQVLNPPDALDLQKSGLSIRRILSAFMAAYANGKWRKSPHYFGPDEYAALYRTYWEKRQPGLVLFEFDGNDAARLQASCRERGVSVGSALSTACLAAYADMVGEFSKKQQTIIVPFDLRRWTNPPVADVFCFCAGGVRVSYNYSLKKSFWDNAIALHTTIHTRLKNPSPSDSLVPTFDPSLLDALAGFGLYVDKVPEAYERTPALQKFAADTGNIVVTFNRNFENTIPGFIPSNLGRIDMPERTGGLRLDRLIFLPAASELNPLVLGGIGVNGSMTFVLPFVDPPATTGISPEREMIRIRNRALEYLGFPEKVNDRAIPD